MVVLRKWLRDSKLDQDSKQLLNVHVLVRNYPYKLRPSRFLAAEAPDMDEKMEEFTEYFECENDLCNEFEYSSTKSILASCLLLLFVSMFW